MSDEGAMRARVAGRLVVAARTAWSLDAGGVRLRCLKQDDGSYHVQARSERGWTEEVSKGPDALALLRAVVTTRGVEIALKEHGSL